MIRYPANSLHARFITASVAVLLACGLLAGLGGYHAAIGEADEILDNQLAQLAHTLLFLSRTEHGNTAGDIGLSERSGHSYLVYQVWKLKPGNSAVGYVVAANGRPYPQLWLRSGEVDSKLMFDRKDGFSSAHWAGRTLRIFAQTSPNGLYRAIVGQDVIDRREMVGKIAWSNIRPYLLVLPFGIVALIWLTYRGLAPIRRFTAEVASRNPGHLNRLDVSDTPKELWPLLQALNVLLDRLDAAMSNERRFTGDAAHELRNPMAALRAQLDALRLADDRETRVQAQQQASATAERMVRLVNQLLTLARLDADDAIPDSTLDLADLARELCGEMAPKAVAAGIDLALFAKPAEMRGDEDALHILLRNLLENALRYTPTGGHVVVHIGRRPGLTRMVVADNGPGVPDSQLQALGQRFQRLGKTDTAGVGLGLSIVRRIVERYHAELKFGKGLGGKGLTVTVDFPDRPG